MGELVRGGSVRLLLSLAWFAFSKEIWLQLKNTTAGRLSNDLMSNSLREKWGKNEKRGLQGNLL